MKYVMLIHHGSTPTPRTPAWEQLSEDERQAIVDGWRELNQIPGVTPGEPMADGEMATTVRVQDGKTLTTDGPFAELKESIAGYFIFEADDIDQAIEVASRVPSARLGGAVEVRPAMEW